MSDPLEKAFDEFADAVEKRVTGLIEEVRGLRTQLETRAAPEPKVIEGPPGKDGTNGIDGKDGKDGADGRPGERGADGIATREELQAEIEKLVAEINVRTFADIYKGVYKAGDIYTRGVLATWGGSLWLSLNETKAKPGETPDWRLIVKK